MVGHTKKQENDEHRSGTAENWFGGPGKGCEEWNNHGTDKN